MQQDIKSGCIFCFIRFNTCNYIKERLNIFCHVAHFIYLYELYYTLIFEYSELINPLL